MIPASRMNNALAAVNAILVVARSMAHDQRPYEELAEMLDVAEYLPRLLAESEDRAAEFREQLVTLAAKYPLCNLAVERFDRTDLTTW